MSRLLAAIWSTSAVARARTLVDNNKNSIAYTSSTKTDYDNYNTHQTPSITICLDKIYYVDGMAMFMLCVMNPASASECVKHQQQNQRNGIN